MRKIIFTLCIVFGCSAMYAGTWVVGVNQADILLSALEQGTADAPPPVVPRNEKGEYVTDYADDKVYPNGWKDFPGMTLTDEDITTNYLGHSDDYRWRGIVAINYAGKGYKQKAETVISLIQPSLEKFDYPGEIGPNGEKLEDYWDRNDLSWLTDIDLSGNDLHTIEISGGPYGEMPLENINLSNNPNLTSLRVEKCEFLEVLDIRGTGLSEAAITEIKEAVLEASETATILTGDIDASVGQLNIDAPRVYINKGYIQVENKATNALVVVYDLYGRSLVESMDNVIDVNMFNSGIYLVKVGNYVTKIKK